MKLQDANGRSRTARHYLIYGLVPASALLSGCAQSPARSLARVWDYRPQLPWSAPKAADAADNEDGDTQIAAKPRDKSTDASPLTNPFRFSTWTDRESRDAIADQSSAPLDPFLEDELTNPLEVAQSEAKTPAEQESVDTPGMVSLRDRLRATLSDDTRRNRTQTVDVAEQDRLRIRVESLMRRANFQFDRGELVAAQRTVELAQNLVKDVDFVFAPDEERPVDLLTKIAARLEAEAAEVTASEQADTDPATSVQTRGTAQHRTIASQVESFDFDPYVEQKSLPVIKPRGAATRHPSLVVLESPSFEDETAASALQPDAVRPTGYSRSVSDQTQPKVAAARRIADAPVLKQEASAPSVTNFADLSDSVAAAALPAIGDDAGPSFGKIELPHIETQTASSQSTPLPELEDLDDLNAPILDEKQVRKASVMPRWLTLSCLSAFAASFSLWLLRRRLTAR